MTTGTTSLSSPSPANLNCNDFTAGPSSTFQTTAGLADHTHALTVAVPSALASCANSLPGVYCLQQ